MPHCAVWFADDQIRESATIGGNLVNASPAGDAFPPLIVHDAQVELVARQGGALVRRRMPLTQFIVGPSKTALQDNEILVAIECGAARDCGGSFEKVGHRRSLVISVACVAALVRIDPAKHTFDEVRLAVGGIGPVPQRLSDVETFLRGKSVNADVIEAAAAMPLHLVRSRTRQMYRQEVLRGFVARSLVQAVQAADIAHHTLTPELEAAYA
jgi:CO/xanthine dehydrogenase FAD-binding subunit